MERLIYSLLTILGLLCFSCGSGHGDYRFLADNDISDLKGMPVDSTVHFMPEKLIFNDTTIVIDRAFWPYGPNFHIAKERILYNYYLGRDIYRFSWFRSFHGPVFVNLYREQANYWLTVTKLNKPYVKYEHIIDFIPPRGTSEEVSKAILENNQKIMDSLNIFPKIEVTDTIPITKDEWDGFEHLLNECKLLGVAAFCTSTDKT